MEVKVCPVLVGTQGQVGHKEHPELVEMLAQVGHKVHKEAPEHQDYRVEVVVKVCRV